MWGNKNNTLSMDFIAFVHDIIQKPLCNTLCDSKWGIDSGWVADLIIFGLNYT